jgi:hypothetical protein
MRQMTFSSSSTPSKEHCDLCLRSLNVESMFVHPDSFRFLYSYASRRNGDIGGKNHYANGIEQSTLQRISGQDSTVLTKCSLTFCVLDRVSHKPSFALENLDETAYNSPVWPMPAY